MTYQEKRRSSMPTLPSGTITRGGLSVGFVDFSGRVRSSRLEVPTTSTTQNVNDLVDAMGNLSNAAVYSRKRDSEDFAPNTALLTTFDEAFASVSDALVFVYVNAANERFYIEVPAPDAVVLTADGSGIAFDNPLVQAFLDAYAVLWPARSLVSAYVSSRKAQRIGGTSVRPNVAEPGAGQNPPPAPGN